MPIEQMIFPFCFLVGAISVLNAFSNSLIPFYLLFIFMQSIQPAEKNMKSPCPSVVVSLLKH